MPVSRRQPGHVAPQDYPSSGIFRQVCAFGDDIQRGEPWGEQGLARGVPPSAASSPVPNASNAKPAGRACGLFQLQSAPRLTGRALRAALFAARTDVTPSARRSMAVPWRERPPYLAGSAITPAATAEVAHATLSLSQSEQAISWMQPAQPTKARAIWSVFIGRRTRLSTASREPLDEQRAHGVIVEFSSTVAARNPLHIARCGALESTASDHDSFLSIHSLVADSRDDTSAKQRSERTALRPQAKAPHPSTLQNRHRHAATACRLSAVDASGAALSAAQSQQNEHAKPASTFKMGRRIMAERRRHRRERRRQHRPHARTNANNQIDAQCDEPLRALARALARQAACELFEAQRMRHSSEIH